MIKQLQHCFFKPVHLAPLAVFRILFGLLMFASVIRFMAKGWVHLLYIQPKFFFTYYGFEWVKPLGDDGMHTVFLILTLSSLFIAFGFFYRFASLVFFLLFTYVELIDKTNYLNHYYFVSIISFLLIFLPAHRYFSVDVLRNKKLLRTHAPNYFLLVIKCQVFIVYFLAGVAKINYEWLLQAQPLKIWLPAHNEMPIIGHLLTQEWVAYVFSWFSCIYDLAIPVFLFIPAFVRPAYFFVILFHLATSLFFNIGMFPYIMIVLTSVFFSEQFHLSLIRRFKLLFKLPLTETEFKLYQPLQLPLKIIALVLGLHFIIQVLVPFRYLLYKGNLLWTEQGYRFSWRVMLMEKAGTAFFYVQDRATGNEIEINNRNYLTHLQEKMMVTQPDMMVDYARHLKMEYEKKGFKDPVVRVQSYVTLNGSGSRTFVDPVADLGKVSNSIFVNKSWITPYRH